MGYGYDYKCKTCKKKYSVRLGIGFSFPSVYRRLLSDIKDGKYGDTFKNILESKKYVAVDAEKELYICKNCGKWETNYILNLYIPKNIEKLLNKQYGIKTVREWGYVPYVMEYDLIKNYKLLRRYVHVCSNCGKRTHKANETDLGQLTCPHCSTKNAIESYVDWD